MCDHIDKKLVCDVAKIIDLEVNEIRRRIILAAAVRVCENVHADRVVHSDRDLGW